MAEIQRVYCDLARSDNINGKEEKMKELKDNYAKALNEAQPERPTKILFVGNPGVGKSTILNGHARELIFKAGVSFGGGLTFQLDQKTIKHITYMDTPGLADVKLRKQAAEAITQALRMGGHFKIFFVVTLEAARLRP